MKPRGREYALDASGHVAKRIVVREGHDARGKDAAVAPDVKVEGHAVGRRQLAVRQSACTRKRPVELLASRAFEHGGA